MRKALQRSLQKQGMKFKLGTKVGWGSCLPLLLLAPCLQSCLCRPLVLLSCDVAPLLWLVLPLLLPLLPTAAGGVAVRCCCWCLVCPGQLSAP